MTCKTLTCCDLEDFPETSSNEDNCPSGYYWNENGQACKRIPFNALFGEDGRVLLAEDGEPLLNE